MVLVPATQGSGPFSIHRRLVDTGLAVVRFDVSRATSLEVPRAASSILGAILRTGDAVPFERVGLLPSENLNVAAIRAASLARGRLGALAIMGTALLPRNITAAMRLFGPAHAHAAAAWLAEMLAGDEELDLGSLRDTWAPRRPRSPLRRLVAAGALAGGTILAAPLPAKAAVTATSSGGVVTVTSDTASDSITVACDGGATEVNGSLVSPPIGCNQVMGMALDGGDGNDGFLLSGVTSGNGFSHASFTLISVTGGTGNDTLLGSPKNETVTGGSGADSLVSGDGNDTLSAEADSDSVDAGSGADRIIDTGSGPDTLEGNTGPDVYVFESGGTGNRVLQESSEVPPAGVDRLDFSSLFSSATVNVDLTNDAALAVISPSGRTISTAAGQAGRFENATGSGQADTLAGNDAGNLLQGGGGNDTITGGDGTDTLGGDSDSGGLGDLLLETIPGTNPNATLGPASLGTGGPINTLSGFERASITGNTTGNIIDATTFTGPVTLDGGDGNDVLTGGLGSDSLIGGTGTTDRIDEEVSGAGTIAPTMVIGNGTDTFGGIERVSLSGDTGPDTLSAATATVPVTMNGDAGTDSLTGSAQADSLTGDDADDTIQGAGGSDTLQAGQGTADQLFEVGDVDFTLSGSTLTSGAAVDTISAFEQASLTGGASENAINAGLFPGTVTLRGVAAGDTLTGSQGGGVLDGADGNDTINGGAGNETILGGDSADTIDAGGGNDSISGGPLSDFLSQEIDADMTLTSSLVTGEGIDTFTTIEEIDLIGGPGNNDIDASASVVGTLAIIADDGNDTVAGGASTSDLLAGGDGTDLLEYGGATSVDLSDTLLNANGADDLSDFELASLTGTAFADGIDASDFSGSVTIMGLAGGDSLTGADGGDQIQGGSEADTLEGEGGDDSLTGAAGSDSLVGGADNDVLVEAGDVDMTLAGSSMTGGLGTDVLGSLESASLTGGAGANVLSAFGFAQSVTIDGAGGSDTVTGGFTGDELDGGPGTDRVDQAAPGNQTLTPTSLTGNGTDTLSELETAALTGGGGANVIDASAFGGSTTLSGEGGSDSLLGGSAGDRVSGGPDSDTLDGNGGTDMLAETGDVSFTLTPSSLTGLGTDSLADLETAHLTGGPSANTLDASAFTGATTLDGAGGDDTFVGGTGADAVVGGDGSDLLTVTSNGNITLGDALVARSSDPLTGIERATITGGDANQVIDATGFTGSVTVDGGGGNDQISSGGGVDSLRGGDGNDKLNPGGGADVAMGDAGNDKLATRDKTKDKVNGGTGKDKAKTDLKDKVKAVERERAK